MTRTQKIILFSIIGVVVAGLTTAIIIRVVRKRKGVVPIKNKNPKKIIIVGDSQSAIENASGGKITYTYPNLLREQLKDKGVVIDVLALCFAALSNPVIERQESRKGLSTISLRFPAWKSYKALISSLEDVVAELVDSGKFVKEEVW